MTQDRPEITYPVRWTYKVIGSDEARLRTAIGAIVGEVEHKQSLEGHFGIQHHGKGGTVSFRNLRARKL